VACRSQARADSARPEHLLDCSEQPVAVLDHDAVELLPLRFVNLAVLQRLQIQLHRRDGCLELVRDGVDERLVLLVAPDLADQEDCVENDAGDDERKDENAGQQETGFPPIEDHPADVERERATDQSGAQDDEKRDRFSAPAEPHLTGAPAHTVIRIKRTEARRLRALSSTCQIVVFRPVKRRPI
jgi:hypothetical protein